MRYHNRLEAIEKKVLPKDPGLAYLVVFSDQDQIEKIAKHKAENPGRPFKILRVNFISSKNDGRHS